MTPVSAPRGARRDRRAFRRLGPRPDGHLATALEFHAVAWVRATDGTDRRMVHGSIPSRFDIVRPSSRQM